MNLFRPAMMAIAMLLLAGCAERTIPPTAEAIVRVSTRPPLWPSDAAIDELEASNLAPDGPAWAYIHDDAANKCG